MPSNRWALALGLALAIAWTPGLQAQLRQISGADAELEAIETRFVTLIRERDFKNDLPGKTARLQADIAAISRIIDGKQVSGATLTAAYMLRGETSGTLNELYQLADKPVDLALARQALADYDKVMAAGQGKEFPSFTTAARQAGGVASGVLQSKPLAYSYYAKCAEAGDAACTNIMATGYTTGAGGLKADVQSALAMHKRTWESGIEYNCAGSYSAGSIGVLTYITGQPFEGADAVTWFQRSDDLAGQVAKRSNFANACQLAGNYVEEYVVRLARGETKPDLLDKAAGLADLELAPLLGLLQGRLDWDGFNKAVAGAADYSSCTLRFHGVWIAMVRKETAAAYEQKNALMELPPDRCDYERALTRLMTR